MQDDKHTASLWHWSLRTYRNNDVAELCLTLQDRFDLDVNVLLWLCHIANQNKAATTHSLIRAQEISTHWQRNWIQGVRKARRSLGSISLQPASAASQTLKQQFLSLELAMEKRQQLALEALPLTRKHGNIIDIAQENLTAYLNIRKIDDGECIVFCRDLCALIFSKTNMKSDLS